MGVVGTVGALGWQYVLPRVKPIRLILSHRIHMDPWDWHIYLLSYHKKQLNVGKYNVRPMDPMSIVVGTSCSLAAQVHTQAQPLNRFKPCALYNCKKISRWWFQILFYVHPYVGK